MNSRATIEKVTTSEFRRTIEGLRRVGSTDLAVISAVRLPDLAGEWPDALRGRRVLVPSEHVSDIVQLVAQVRTLKRLTLWNRTTSSASLPLAHAMKDIK
jgi:hypothetical protein